VPELALRVTLAGEAGGARDAAAARVGSAGTRGRSKRPERNRGGAEWRCWRTCGGETTPSIAAVWRRQGSRELRGRAGDSDTIGEEIERIEERDERLARALIGERNEGRERIWWED
jgi:hypothetical protein